MGNPRIVRSNAPEVVILNSKPTVTGQDKAKELAAIAKKNGGKTDWAKWITSTGGGLLGYSLASSFLDDKTYEEKRKESNLLYHFLLRSQRCYWILISRRCHMNGVRENMW